MKCLVSLTSWSIVVGTLLLMLAASCDKAPQAMTSARPPALPRALIRGQWMAHDGDPIACYRRLYTLYLDGKLTAQTAELVKYLIEGSLRKGESLEGLIETIDHEREGRNARTFFRDMEGQLSTDEEREALLVLAWRLMQAGPSEPHAEGIVAFIGLGYVAQRAERSLQALRAERRDEAANEVNHFLEQLTAYQRERRREIEERLRRQRP